MENNVFVIHVHLLVFITFVPYSLLICYGVINTLSFAAGVLINIECKAWAKNIVYDRYERRGSVHFELMVDRS